MEPDLRRFASDGSHIDVRLGTDENDFCSASGIRRANREEGCECKNSNDVGLLGYCSHGLDGIFRVIRDVTKRHTPSARKKLSLFLEIAASWYCVSTFSRVIVNDRTHIRTGTTLCEPRSDVVISRLIF